jgi:hypothetical protein
MPRWLPWRRRSQLLWLFWVLLALVLVLVTHSLVRDTAPLEPGRSMGVAEGEVVPLPALQRPAEPLRLAVRLSDVRGLDLSSKTFKLQGELWLNWDQPLQRRIAAGTLDPLKMLRFVNQVEEWNAVFEAVGPVRPSSAPAGGGPGGDPGGGPSFIQQIRFSGLFYVNDVDLRNAPFIPVELPLIIEVVGEDLALERQGVLLQPAPLAQRVSGSGAGMAGFELTGSSLRSWLHRLDDPFVPDHQLSFSRLVLSLHYRTNTLSAVIAWLLPLAVVMAIVLLAPSLDSSRDDLTFALPSAGLLTMVVLQDLYRQQVPSTPYLTFLDQLYAYSYVVAMAVFLLFVWGGNRLARAVPERLPEVQEHVNRVCTVMQLSSLLGYAVIVAWELLL